MGDGIGIDQSDESLHSVNSLIVALQTEVRAIADQQLASEQPGHTLQPTAIVNEAYMRLIHQKNLHGATRTKFLAAAARTIQRILVDHARAKYAKKRGGDWVKISLDGLELSTDSTQFGVAAMNDALEKLAGAHERIHQVVILRYFGGMTADEVAEELNVSPRTVAEDWTFARAWLKRELGD